MTAPGIKLLIVDDHDLVREGLVALCKESSDLFQYCMQATNGLQALDFIHSNPQKPDVVLMDLIMPVMDGIEATSNIRNKYNDKIKVLALTMLKQSSHIRKALQAGASGYVLKNCDKNELFLAIQKVNKGEYYYSKEVSIEVLNQWTNIGKSENDIFNFSITKRESDVLTLLTKNYNNKEIAETLHISLRTVETHKHNLLSKTGSKNLAGLVIFAIKNRLVEV